jgi:bifunctional non-homologous end joining protein LigD
MLWVRGSLTPEVPDVAAALKKGDLKFTLDGFKLKGSWVLVRTGGRWGSKSGGGDARSWLLIKHRDDWAGDVDITEFAPLSVKSGGDFENILAAERPDVWESNRPAKGGDAGAMLATIIERAAQLKAGRQSPAPAAPPAAARRKPASRPAAAKSAAAKPRSAKPGTARKPATRKTPGAKRSGS